jgi:N-acyl-D-aspartate/D-glutamate deacylase
MHDLIIRNGTIVDGTGRPAFTGDMAIDGGVIAAVGPKAGAGRREIDASGLLVTPGWVDIHTHYDGQVTWDPYLTPSSWHGVTTIVMGNCGVGFAPVMPGKEEFLIGLMEGVEDIPGPALAAGIPWQWESFAQYLDALERMPRAIDVAAQIPHGAVRAYVMGERGAHNEESTSEDIARMAAVVREALRAGAIGVTSSRTLLHRAKNGEHVPGTFASEAEMTALGLTLGDAGHGVMELATDMVGPDTNLEWMAKVSIQTGRPITILATAATPEPLDFERVLGLVRSWKQRGARLVPQVAARPACILMGLETTVHPFSTHRAYRSLVGRLKLAERVARMRDPEVRTRILNDEVGLKDPLGRHYLTLFDSIFALGDPPNYEPSREMSVAAQARREGRTPAEVAYDLLLQRDGRELLYVPLGDYLSYDLERNRRLLIDPDTRLGVSDGGAHCGMVCDASAPTFMLTHWVRDRDRGPRLGLEQVVRFQTGETAELYGFYDRGVLAPGMKADVNVIDFAGLHLYAPEIVYDFPAAARRLIQKVDGYKYTVVSGAIIYENGAPTGALPGKLVRGGRIARPAA